MDFYDSLLCSTSSLFITVVAIHFFNKLVRAKGKPEDEAKAIMDNSRFITGYILLFAFPIVSVDLVEAFACHEVCTEHECTSYLRADYSIQCFTNRFYIMSTYAALWVLGYVCVFPVFLFWKLVRGG